jgi:hypothetical protein
MCFFPMGFSYMETHLKNVIKEQITKADDPYMKCVVINSSDYPDMDRESIEHTCSILTDELGFRFKIDFQPEYCILKALMVPNREGYIFKSKNALARFCT